MKVIYDADRDAYRLLQIDPQACPEVVGAAYRALSKIHHPDIANGNNNKFAQINAAHDVLRDPASRAIYDTQRRQVVEAARTQQRDVKIGFGKYRGLSMSEVPTDYLLWCLANLTNPAQAFDMQQELKRRGWETP